MSEVKAGGMAMLNGIIFQSSNHKVIARRDKDGTIKVESSKFNKLDKKESRLNNVLSLPFIRSYDILIQAIIQGWKLIVLLIIFTFVLTTIGSSDSNTSINSIVESPFYTYALFLVFAVIFKFTSIAKYHSAEHMGISALENDIEINLENVSKQSRIHKRCGTNLVIFVLLIYAIFDLIGLNDIYKILIAYPIAFELFVLKNGTLRKILSPFYKLGYFIQEKLTTSKPEQYHLEVAIVGINKLKELEGWK